MAKGPNQKSKLLYLVKIFKEQSDEQHPLSAAAKELKSRMQQSISTEAGNEL